MKSSKRSIRKGAGFLAVLLLGLWIVGCGSKGAAEQESGTQGKAEGGAEYIAEELTLPQEHISNAVADQNILYYLNQDSVENGVAKETIYRLDMGAEQSEPTVIPMSPEEGHNISSMVVDSTGKLHLLSYQAKGSTITDVAWMKGDGEGNRVGTVSLYDLYREQGNQFPVDFEVDETGNLYVAMSNTIFVLDSAGNTLYQAMCDGMVSFLCRDDANRIYAVWYATKEGLSMGIAEIDSKTKGLGAKHNLSMSEILVGVSGGTEGNLLLASTGGVTEYHVKEKTTTEKFQWSALDVASSYYGLFLPLADGRCLWLDRTFQDDKTVTSSLTVIRPRKEGEAAEKAKKTLTFGGISMFIDAAVREAIVNFNRTNPDYRIEIKEYGKDNLETGMEQMNGDIASGNCPDIMALPIGFSMDLYTGKGILEDLNPYLEKDSSVTRGDLQENILGTFEKEGKLYGMPISYIIYSIMGKTTLLGEQTSWNLDEMIAFAKRSGDGASVFANASQSGVLSLCVEANKEILINGVDQEKGFNREVFAKILEFSKGFTPDEKYVADDMSALAGKIGEDQVQLMETAVTNVANYQLYNAIFGEPVTYAGYPTENGNGSLAGSLALIAISSRCPDKEAAWQFISSMLTKEFQENPNLLMGLPIRKSGLEKKFTEAMKATYTTDENGNQKEEPKGSINVGSSTIEIYAATEEEIQSLRDLIGRVNKMQQSDNQAFDIISEEAQAYFTGAKSADEVADVVENRLRLYRNEMK